MSEPRRLVNILDTVLPGGLAEHRTHRNRVYHCNPAEEQFCRAAIESGWSIGKRGWPDYWCIKGDRLICVEVKPHRRDPLRPDQERVMRLLTAHGIACFIWSPDGGFTRILPT